MDPLVAPPAAAPATARERILLLDVLRALALFGVLLVNMTWFAGRGPDPILSAAFETAFPSRLDELALQFIDHFVTGYANTVFAFLFGFGFAVQMDRLRARSPHPEAVYARRLAGLLIIGLFHLFAVWRGDILHAYALAGFALLLLSRLHGRALTALAVLVAVASQIVYWRAPGLLAAAADAVPAAAHTSSADATAAALAQSVFNRGGYVEIVASEFSHTWHTYVLGGGFFLLAFYALGRFLLGLVVARTNVLQDPDRHGRALLLALGTAVVVFLAALGVQAGIGVLAPSLGLSAAALDLVMDVLGALRTLARGAFYVAGIAVLWRWPVARSLMRPLAPLGRMALTCYLSQSIINSWIYFGFGLGLIGKVGPAGCVLLTVLIFAAQAAGSAIWLRYFCFGPAEWLWRWWTYGVQPPFVLARVGAPAGMASR